MSSIPGHRPALVDFANLITKKTSLLICGHVMTGDQVSIRYLNTLKDNVQNWMKDHGIQGFYVVNHSNDFEAGARNCITMAGLGKLSPNLLLMGFKSDWRQSMYPTNEYFNTILCAFDQKYSVLILRVKDGFDYSGAIGEDNIAENMVENTDEDVVYEGDEDSLSEAVSYPFHEH